jgi:hypothetical protein
MGDERLDRGELVPHVARMRALAAERFVANASRASQGRHVAWRSATAIATAWVNALQYTG